jgi:hypothetical protein
VKVTLMLADAAQAVGGKLYVLGGGWSNIYGAAPFAIAIKIEVPWSRASESHDFRLELLDADGHPVELPQEDGSTQPLVIEGQVSTGIAPGVKAGTPMDAVLAISLGPLPLDVGRYEWRLTIDGDTQDDWRLAFNRMDPPSG